MFTLKLKEFNIDMYNWDSIDRFVQEFDFTISAHKQIISLGTKNLNELNKKLNDEVNEILNNLREQHPNDEEYTSQTAYNHGAYESNVILNYSEILWKSIIVYQVNQIESHLKALSFKCSEFFQPDTDLPTLNQKIISTYHEYLIKTCGIESSKLNRIGPKMIKYYKVRNCIVHDDSVPNDEVKKIIMDYKNIGYKQRSIYKPLMNQLLNETYCLVMLNDIELYFKELYACIDNIYEAIERGKREAGNQISK